MNKPEAKFDPRLHKVIFLGFAPNVTNGYWVMNKNDKIELTSNITEDLDFDRVEPLMEPTFKEHDRPQPALHDFPDTDKDLQAIADAEAGYGDLFKNWSNQPQPDDPDDPMEVVSKVQLSKISENLWNEEDIRQEEIPDRIQEEIRESGAITVPLRDVRQSIGKDRQNSSHCEILEQLWQ